jgi:polar amino acid transport system substrate-binding protein
MKVIPLLLALLSFTTIAEERSFILASTKSMPPYLYQSTKTGIEYEIVIEALNAAKVVDIQHIDVHFKRGIMLINTKSIDGITSNLANSAYIDTSTKLYESAPTLNYIDCAISLKENNFKLTSIKNFYKKKIWAFKSASTTLGEEFNQMTKINKGYTENYSQELQVKVLVNKRIDIAISDKNIFLSRLSEEDVGSITKDHFVFHSIGEPTKRVVRFYDRELRDKFNKGLEVIKKNGTYKKILEKYKNLYFSKC